MAYINADIHPGLHRYDQELRQYPQLTEEQYSSVLADLKQPEESDAYQNAREKMVCSHLGMVLGMAVTTIYRYYGLSMEDFVGIGNLTLVELFDRFDPDRGAMFASYMKKNIVRREYDNVRSHVIWERDEDVDIEQVGISDDQDDDPNYDRLHRAIGSLLEWEQMVIYYSFFDDYRPKDEEIAKKLRMSKNYLVKARIKILGKLRRMLKARPHHPDRRYIVESKEER